MDGLGQVEWDGAMVLPGRRELPLPGWFQILALASAAAEVGSCWPSFSFCQNNSLCFFRKILSPPLFHCFCVIVFYNTGISNSCNLIARCGNWFSFFSALQADCKPVPGCYYSPSRQFSRHEGEECSPLWGQCFDS